MSGDGDRVGAIALLGSPGAGKGTLARRLEQTCGVTHLDLGHLLRVRAVRPDLVGRRIVGAQTRGDMVPKEVVLEVLFEHLGRLDPARTLVLDGFPRTTAQLAATDDGRVPIRIERAIWLDVPREVAQERLRRRAAHAPRNDDGDATARQRFALMSDTVDAVRRAFAARGLLETVDATRTPDEVLSDVVELITPLTTRC